MSEWGEVKWSKKIVWSWFGVRASEMSREKGMCKVLECGRMQAGELISGFVNKVVDSLWAECE